MPVIRLIACDVDGTLLRDGQTKLSSQVAEEIVRLQAKGILFCPASGRQYNSLQESFSPPWRTSFITSARMGAVIFAPGSPDNYWPKRPWSGPLPWNCAATFSLPTSAKS